MAQFTIYTSDDAGAPQLSGAAGTLLTVLDACLVNGYGAKSGAGWTKPIANSGNCGHYKQGAGSEYHFYVNDNGPNVTSTYREAWACGWKTMSAITAPVGVGGGQFPAPWQQLTTGHIVIRKSSATSSSTRQWKVIADNRTFYLFIISQEYTNQQGFEGTFFGDYYSFAGSTDPGKCWIGGRFAENFDGAPTRSQLHTQGQWWISLSGQSYTPWTCFDLAGVYTADATGGTRGSALANLLLDCNVSYVQGSGDPGGYLATPNPNDTAYYMVPCFLFEPTAQGVGGILRGRARGMWGSLHQSTLVSSGQTIAGTGDFAGKTFTAVRGVNANTASERVWWFETSNTVDTN